MPGCKVGRCAPRDGPVVLAGAHCHSLIFGSRVVDCCGCCRETRPIVPSDPFNRSGLVRGAPKKKALDRALVQSAGGVGAPLTPTGCLAGGRAGCTLTHQSQSGRGIRFLPLRAALGVTLRIVPSLRSVAAAQGRLVRHAKSAAASETGSSSCAPAPRGERLQRRGCRQQVPASGTHTEAGLGTPWQRSLGSGALIAQPMRQRLRPERSISQD